MAANTHIGQNPCLKCSQKLSLTDANSPTILDSPDHSNKKCSNTLSKKTNRMPDTSHFRTYFFIAAANIVLTCQDNITDVTFWVFYYFLSPFKINFGTMESETPLPPPGIQKRQCSTASALLFRDYANGTNPWSPRPFRRILQDLWANGAKCKIVTYKY